MLILELNLMVKKKAEGSGRSSKAKGKITGDKPEEPQERQDKESRDVNSPRSIEEKPTEARDQRNQPRSEPYVSRYRSRHRRGSHSIRQGAAESDTVRGGGVLHPGGGIGDGRIDVQCQGHTIEKGKI